MEIFEIGSVLAGVAAGIWFARRPRLSGKLAVAFSLLPYLGVGVLYAST
jgi:hypothetical protein